MTENILYTRVNIEDPERCCQSLPGNEKKGDHGQYVESHINDVVAIFHQTHDSLKLVSQGFKDT